MSEAKNSLQKSKSGGEVAEQVAEQSAGARRVKRSKMHADYWKTRLFNEGYSRDGKRFLSGDWSVRIGYEGRREAFNLETANRAEAAAKAQGIYAALVATGWEATVAKYKPGTVQKDTPGTVGEAITAARELSTTRPQSFEQAAMRLRQIAAEVGGVRKTAKATAYRSPRFAEWREKIDAIPLTKITPEAVRSWRDQRIAARAKNPIEKRAATISADSAIRMARAVFSKRILAAGLGAKVKLPTPLPFVGITVGASTKRFSEKVDAAQLFAAGRAELERDGAEAFRAFALGILAGLRRSEADRLTWAQVDLAARTIKIERTAYFEPKSEESERLIDLDDVAVEILRRAKSDSPNPVFVLKGAIPREQIHAATTYRADAAPWRTWRKLAVWLREKGIKDGKPIHVLRKLAGSLVFAAHGLEQARGFLGHASISTTSDSYLAVSRRVTVSIPAPSDEVSEARKEQSAKG